MGLNEELQFLSEVWYTVFFPHSFACLSKTIHMFDLAI